MSRTRSAALLSALFLSSLPFVAGACSSTPDEEDEAPKVAAPASPEAAAAAAAATAKEDAAQKVLDLGNQIEMAKRRIDRAKMDLDQQKSDGDAAIAKATAELDLAKKAVAHFDAVEAPQKLAKAELDLKDSNDYSTEQAEEMAQLELMYQKDDLADKTKEIVLARGKRRLERAKQRLALAQKDWDDLKAVQLPEQRTRLALTQRDRELDLQRAKFGAQTGMMDKETAQLGAQQEIEKLQRELAKAQKTASG